METNDFFQNEAKRCRDDAERATKKDREFLAEPGAEVGGAASSQEREQCECRSSSSAPPTAHDV